ncbi:hypothetical protein C0J52_01497 [Blattella germanica]|nr:hypothetical protein C0J52_01497 [Blattella germanica]
MTVWDWWPPRIERKMDEVKYIHWAHRLFFDLNLKISHKQIVAASDEYSHFPPRRGGYQV